MDMTTNNHASTPGDTPPWVYVDSQALAPGGDCAKERKAENDACKDLQVMQKGDNTKIDRSATEAAFCAKNKKAKACQKARQCMLVPYKPDKQEKKEIGCCPGKTPHHVIPKSSFSDGSGNLLVGWKKYNADRAPCVCADGHSYYDGTHGDLHTRYGVVAEKKKDAKGNWNRKDAASAGAKSVTKTFPESNCSQKCLEAQLNSFHDKAISAKPDKPIRATHPMGDDPAKKKLARAEMMPGRSTR